jgi:hypothetical protein
MATSQFDLTSLQSKYQDMTGEATAFCKLRTTLVGGMPATETGIQAFIRHYLKLDGEDAAIALSRLTKQEIGKRDIAPPEAELLELSDYNICVIRRSEFGPWLGDWMIKACLKAAASRVGLYVAKKGTKGDIAEMGSVMALGTSLADADNPQQVHLVDASDNPAQTSFQEFRGRISTPQGSLNIVNHKEVAPAGTRFAFAFRWYNGKIKENDIANIFAAAMNIGLGSAKSFENGKFSVEDLVVNC